MNTTQTAEANVNYGAVSPAGTESQPPSVATPIAQSIESKILEIKSIKLRTLLDKQNSLVDRLQELAKLPDMRDQVRQKAILEAELSTVRAEVAKRQEDVGELAVGLFALYDELGLQSQKAGGDSAEDISRRNAALKRVDTTVEALGSAKAEKVNQEAELLRVTNHWWPFGKQAAIKKSESAVSLAQGRIEAVELALQGARENIAVVEEQIAVDKADRIRNASLSENFALIREFTERATTILKEEIETSVERLGLTENALKSALVKKIETARALDAMVDAVGLKGRDLTRERNALDEIPDQSSEMYAVQQKVVAEIEGELTRMRGEELQLNTMNMAMTQAIEANKSSVAGLTVQIDTARVHLTKLTVAEKTASILGRNIEQMVRNSTQEAASDALDRATDSMTLSAMNLGVQAEVASAKARNDAIARHKEMMIQMEATRKVGDEAVAIEAQRYAELDESIRKGYAARGIDVEMGHLQAALENVKPVVPKDAGNVEVTY